jgi:LmbE family N-acetylglucosaminyl deacetylase
MLASAFFHAVESLPLATLDELTGMQPFVVVAPHPDDETLGCAGLMAEARACALEFRIIIVTDGGASHRSQLYPRERLVKLRKNESLAAAEQIGVPRGWLSDIGLPDGATPLEGPVFDSTATAIADLAGDARARTLFVTSRHDPHCDHQAVHDIVRTAARHAGLKVWSYPIWGWHLPPDKKLTEARALGVRLDIGKWLEVKRAAIRCHRSQMTKMIADDPYGFSFTREMLAPFERPFEYFLRSRDDP